jgi:hypothetical protein
MFRFTRVARHSFGAITSRFRRQNGLFREYHIMDSKLLSRIAALASACTIFLGVAGCSSASDAGLTSNVDAGAIVQHDDANPDPEPIREPIQPRELSPLDEFRNILWSMEIDEESQVRQFEADRMRQEDLIAQCMNDLGFEYVPFLGWNSLWIRGAENWHPDDMDWVAVYGYGITVSPGNRGGITGSVDFNTPGNPNIALRDALSDAGAAEFMNSLQGHGTEGSIALVGETHRNCMNWSSYLVQNERQVSRREEFAPLMEAISQMYDNLRWEPSDADRAWASCMFDTGFPGLELQWQAADTIVRELNDLRSTITQHPNWDSGTEPTPENSPEMAELHQREVAMATADLNCRITTDFAAGREAHIHAVENQFISDHRAALEALRSAAEQQG